MSDRNNHQPPVHHATAPPSVPESADTNLVTEISELNVVNTTSTPNTTTSAPSDIPGLISSAVPITTLQATPQSNVPSVPIQDSPQISTATVPRDGDPLNPSVAAPAKDNYTPGNSVASATNLINKLQQLKDQLKYPVRNSIRTNQREKVDTNYFEITVNPTTTFYEY
ncbi:hypothetical protein FB567DRAFT_588376 [Paraphoma chrysanthemicola]|uniref:Uncharacterized protein n=1 Tax=Paraphoma chrysanthemicola TaxID=798071 RepID=A0A8K0RDD5_9PLEO|nr:hypothetical protein FB567DRAFT_588376 [Paraphoma chrysanthemicola]